MTPYEDPARYDPAWRHKVAVQLSGNPSQVVPSEIRKDEWIQRQMGFLRDVCHASPAFFDSQATPERQSYRIYFQEHQSNARDFLEPLLLTDQSCEVIAKDINYAQDTVEYYEKLYFSCRDFGVPIAEAVKRGLALGSTNGPTGRMGDSMLWKHIAACAGYAGIMCIWNWRRSATTISDRAAVLDKMVEIGVGQLMAMAVKGNLEALDINMLMAQHISYARLKHDTESKDTKTAQMELVKTVFEMLAPSMNVFAQSGAALKSYQEGSSNLALAEGAIDAMDIPDVGGMTASRTLNEKLTEQLAPLARESGASDKEKCNLPRGKPHGF